MSSESLLAFEHLIEVVSTTAYVIDKMPQRIIKMQTPHELLFKETPNYNKTGKARFWIKNLVLSFFLTLHLIKLIKNINYFFKDEAAL